MKSYTIDASIAGKWYFPEQHSEKASSILKTECHCGSPDLILAEFTSIVSKKIKLNQISLEDARIVLDKFFAFPLSIHETHLLIRPAFEISHALKLTIYDCLYVAHAIKTNSLLLTADSYLFKAIHASPFKDSIMWVEDI
jgi:predicted nucleic acid-binding protein